MLRLEGHIEFVGISVGEETTQQLGMQSTAGIPDSNGKFAITSVNYRFDGDIL